MDISCKPRNSILAIRIRMMLLALLSIYYQTTGGFPAPILPVSGTGTALASIAVPVVLDRKRIPGRKSSKEAESRAENLEIVITTGPTGLLQQTPAGYLGPASFIFTS
jgi:hypothetical protein